MKKSPAVFNEDVSHEFRSRVLQSGKTEFAEKSQPNIWLRQFLKTGLTAASLLFLTWWSSRIIPDIASKELDQAALLDADLELLENLDWLEDLDILNEIEELETWENS